MVAQQHIELTTAQNQILSGIHLFGCHNILLFSRVFIKNNQDYAEAPQTEKIKLEQSITMTRKDCFMGPWSLM